MFKGQVINSLLEERDAKKIDLYTYAGISRATLDNIISGKTDTTVSRLEKVADFFGVSMDLFFERTVSVPPRIGNNVKITGSKNRVKNEINLSDMQKEKEIEHLNQLLAEKERLIKVLLKNQKDV